MDKEKWMETVLHQIRFVPDRKKIRQELSEHMEDRLEEYLNSGSCGENGDGGNSEGGGNDDSAMDGEKLTAEEAEARVLKAMGDPQELGLQLNRQHKPWLGWLWLGSWAAVAIAVVLIVCILVFGWVEQQAEKNQTGKAFLNLEEAYESMSRDYDPEYNQSGDILYNWEPDWSVTAADTEITFRNFAFDKSDGRLVVILTTEGKYSMVSSVLEIKCSAAESSFAESQTGLDQEGNRVGVYRLTYQRFPRDTGTAKFSYNKFGEAFAFTIDLRNGEVTP